MEATSRTLPAMHFAAFHDEIPTDNNSSQVPKFRMPLNDLKDWPHEGSVTVSLLSVGFPSQKMVDCVELLGSLHSFQRRQSSSLKNKNIQTKKLLGLHITSHQKCSEWS